MIIWLTVRRPALSADDVPGDPSAVGREHGSKGAVVFRDPNEDDRVWVLFDWDVEGFQRFASDPEVPPIMQEAGHKGRPQVAELDVRYEA